MVKVSVLIPCYNGEKFIDRCMTSIINQNFNDMEVIVVDDGSEDQSKSILNHWHNEFTKVGIIFKYVYQSNKGLGSAINTGLKYVDGDYLTLLDIDDIFLPDSIKMRVLYLDENPESALVRSDGYIVKEENQSKILRCFLSDETEKDENKLFELLIKGKTYNWAGSYMLRTSLLFSFYPNRDIYESKFGQNLQLILPVCFKRKTGHISLPLMKYILQEKSLSQENEVNKAYSKEISNIDGYYDIRKHMLFEVGCFEQYKDCLNDFYNRSRFNLALQYNHKNDAKKYFTYLKANKALSKEDKFLYYSLCNTIYTNILSLFYRILLKIDRIF